MTDTTVSQKSRKPIHCNFCGSSQHEVRKLIAGPTSFICDECVVICVRSLLGKHDINILKFIFTHVGRDLFDRKGNTIHSYPHAAQDDTILEKLKELILAINPDYFINAQKVAEQE